MTNKYSSAHSNLLNVSVFTTFVLVYTHRRSDRMNSVDEIVHNLKTIGSLTAGDRISTAKRFITIDNRSAQFLWRTVSADSREKSISAVCREVRLAITLMGLITESSRIQMHVDNPIEPPDEIVMIVVDTQQSMRAGQLRDLYAALSSAQSGISALCGTYDDDADARGELSPLHNEIAAALSNALTVMLELGIPRKDCSGASWNIPRI